MVAAARVRVALTASLCALVAPTGSNAQLQMSVPIPYTSLKPGDGQPQPTAPLPLVSRDSGIEDALGVALFLKVTVLDGDGWSGSKAQRSEEISFYDVRTNWSGNPVVVAVKRTLDNGKAGPRRWAWSGNCPELRGAVNAYRAFPQSELDRKGLQFEQHGAPPLKYMLERYSADGARIDVLERNIHNEYAPSWISMMRAAVSRCWLEKPPATKDAPAGSVSYRVHFPN